MEEESIEDTIDKLIIKKLALTIVGDHFSNFMLLITGDSPQDVADLFITTAADLKLASAIMTIAIVAAVACSNSVERTFNKLTEIDPDIYTTLSNAYIVNEKINFSILYLTGQCLLQNGYGRGNKFIDEYRTLIMADSIFDPSFDPSTLASMEGAATAVNLIRKTFSIEDVSTAGVAMLGHLYTLYDTRDNTTHSDEDLDW